MNDADTLIDRETVIDLSKRADRAWPLTDFGRGKTAERRRYRKALTNVITNGRTSALDELTVAEGRNLEHDLAMIARGDWQTRATETALVIVCRNGDRTSVDIECPWASQTDEAITGGEDAF